MCVCGPNLSFTDFSTNCYKLCYLQPSDPRCAKASTVGCLFYWHCYLHLTFLVCCDDLERIFECLVWCLKGWFLYRAVRTSF
eukprot:jgi/Botrbrau1/17240/Bobra.0015s0003.1